MKVDYQRSKTIGLLAILITEDRRDDRKNQPYGFSLLVSDHAVHSSFPDFLALHLLQLDRFCQSRVKQRLTTAASYISV